MADAEDGQPERHCRICMAARGPGGLADALVEPCGCRGTAAWAHLSCLHEWRVQKARQLRDPARCEVCGEPYRVPASVWRAYAAARGGGAGWQLSLVAAWQRLRPALTAAAALTWKGVRLYLQARHLCLWLGHAGYASVDEEQLPPLVAAAAFPSTDRLQQYLDHMLRWSVLNMALERMEFGQWRPVLQGRFARLLLLTALSWGGVAAAARLQRACAVPWDAPGAPAKEPAAAVLAAGVHRLAVLLAAVSMSRVPAQWHTLLELLPGFERSSLLLWLNHAASSGYKLMLAAARQANEDGKHAMWAHHVQRLFAARPVALAALHAAAARGA